MNYLLSLLLAAGAPAADCPARLAELGTNLPKDGFIIEPSKAEIVRAVYSEAFGRIVIEYRCDKEGVSAAIDNQGLPSIPFKVLLAAGPRATLTSSAPEWLRRRIEATSD